MARTRFNLAQRFGVAAAIFAIVTVIWLFGAEQPEHDPETCVPCSAERLEHRGFRILYWLKDSFILNDGTEVDLDGRPL